MRRADLPQVKGVAPADEGAITLILESGEVVTLTASSGTCMHVSGVLVSDYKHDGPVYFIPRPHLRWLAKAHLGLHSPAPDDREQRLDAYLLALTSITEVNRTEGVLTLGHVGRSGKRYFAQFSGDVRVNFEWDVTTGNFTRFPLRVVIQQGQGDAMKLVDFRIDHTPEGYAALTALGWLAALPALEGVRPADLLNAAD